MKKFLKKLAFKNKLFYAVFYHIFRFDKVKIDNSSDYVLLKKDIVGKNNYIKINENTTIHKALVRMHGNNNKLIIGKNITIGKGCSFWIEGDNIVVCIGDECTFTRDIQINAQENNSSITIGKDCMFSNNIIVRTSDSHPIYDIATEKRINCPKDVIIGNHVWIAPNSKIMKGVNIGNGSIIGSDTLVTKNIESNVLAVGHPAKVVKNNIKWTREKLF